MLKAFPLLIPEVVKGGHRLGAKHFTEYLAIEVTFYKKPVVVIPACLFASLKQDNKENGEQYLLVFGNITLQQLIPLVDVFKFVGKWFKRFVGHHPVAQRTEESQHIFDVVGSVLIN